MARCPNCDIQNPPGLEFCEHCHTVLMHSAPKGYQRVVQKEAQRRKHFANAQETHRQAKRQAAFQAGKRALWNKSYWLPLVLGGTLILMGFLHYQSPLTQLSLYGSRLSLAMSAGQPTAYFVGINSEVEFWAAPDERRDVPMEKSRLSETGSLTVTAAPDAGNNRIIKAQATQWVRTLHHLKFSDADSIPTTHPSMIPAAMITDTQGTVVERRTADRTRVGRAIALLFPRFPKGSQRPGSTWSEHEDWEEMIGGWKFRFQGTAQWTVKDYEPCPSGACVRLSYSVKMETPLVIHAPSWVYLKPAGALAGADPLEGSGEALYDAEQKILISNSLTYQGGFNVPVTRLEEVPWDERPTDAPLEGPGVIRVRLSDKMDIRKS